MFVSKEKNRLTSIVEGFKENSNFGREGMEQTKIEKVLVSTFHL